MIKTMPALISVGAVVGIVVAVVLVIIIISIIVWWISTGNSLKSQAVKIDESASDIDVALTKRYDLLTKELGIVKGYAKHESETLVGVVEARTGYKAGDAEEMAKYNNKLDELASKINLVVERYPDLKANQNFLSLQATAADTEEHLQASRRLYNSNVSIFNQNLVTFPRSLVAHSLKLQPRKFFQAEEAKRQDVKMEF